MSSQSPIDPERMAALIDGRLNSREAAAVRAQLAAADDDTLAAFADAVRINSALDASKARVTIEARSPGVWKKAWLLVPATLAAAAALVLLMKTAPSVARDSAPVTLVAQLSGTVTVPAERPWSADRGAGGDLSLDALSVRVGVLLVDIEVALRAGSLPLASARARELVTFMDGVMGGTAVAEPYKRLAELPASTTAAERAVAQARIAQVLNAVPLNAGSYLELLVVAAGARDSVAIRGVAPVIPATSAPELRDSLSAALGRTPLNLETVGRTARTLLLSMTR